MNHDPGGTYDVLIAGARVVDGTGNPWRYGDVALAGDRIAAVAPGGRIGRAAALVGGILNLKPLLRVDEGQVVPFERTRTRSKAVQGLVDFVKGLPHVERLCVLYSTSAEDGTAFADQLTGVVTIPREQILIAQMSPVIGTHIGPGAMGVAVYEGENG